MKRRRAASVLLITQYFPPERGAAQVRLGAIVRELARRGRSVSVVTALPNYPTGEIFAGWPRRPITRDADGTVRIWRVWIWAAMGTGVRRMANYASFGLMSLLGMMAAGRRDWLVVEYPTLPGALPAVVWGRLRRMRTIVVVADLWVDSIAEVGVLSDGAALRVLRSVERWMLQRADVVTPVTEGVRERLIDKGVDPARMAWLPNGVDTATIRPGEPDPAVLDRFGRSGASRPYAVYAGTHGYVHGLDVLVEAATLLDGVVDIVMVGDGSEKPRLVELARELGATNVTFHDPVSPDDVADLLRGALCGVATVRGGDLYRTVRSAKMYPVMATGRPLVYSADDEGSALVAAAGAGVVTPPGDGPALAAAIRRLAADDDLAAELGANGRRWVEDNAGWDRLVGRWLEQLDADVPVDGGPDPDLIGGHRS